MKKTIIMQITLSVVVFIVVWYVYEITPKGKVVISSPTNTVYLLNGEHFTLVNGKAEKVVVPVSAIKNKVSVFGEPAYGDVDGDGDNDAVVVLVNDAGSSGTFYYAAIAINIGGEYKGTDALLLGDRIAPQSFYVQDNRAIVNYAERAPDESFAVQPSMGKSIHLQFDPNTLRLIQATAN